MLDHTVLVLSHDQGRHLGPCIESLLNQTRRPGEILVCPFGAADTPAEILGHFGAAIRLAGNPGRTPPVPPTDPGLLQEALRSCSGRIVFLLDAADRFKPEKVEHYAAAFARHPDASLVQAPLENIDAQGRVVGATVTPRYHITNHLREIYRRHDVDFFYPTSALAFSRYYLERVVTLDLDPAPGLTPATRLCPPAPYYGRVITLPDPLSERRVSQSQIQRPAGPPPDAAELLATTRVFNAFCRRHGLRTISPWRNPRLYLQFLRRLTPHRVSD